MSAGTLINSQVGQGGEGEGMVGAEGTLHSQRAEGGG